MRLELQAASMQFGTKHMIQSDKRNAILAGTRARRRGIWPPAGLILLGACAAFGPPDIETSRTYPGASPDELYQRTLQALRASDLEVTVTDQATGVITAVGRVEERDWAKRPQPQRLVEGEQDQQQLVPACKTTGGSN